MKPERQIKQEFWKLGWKIREKECAKSMNETTEFVFNFEDLSHPQTTWRAMKLCKDAKLRKELYEILMEGR